MMKKYNINQTTLKILGLYRNDYRRSLHLRQISRETNVDVKAIQLQLKRLEKTNVLASTRKGRNKEYCVDLGNPITEYHMILAEAFTSICYLSRNFLIKKIVSEIKNMIDGIVILFGSFAEERITKESDIDLFILAEKKLDLNVIREIGDLVGREISIKLASQADFLKGLENRDPLIGEVVSKHIVLKGIDNFCDIMWRYYA